jgi:hypothetical protein
VFVFVFVFVLVLVLVLVLADFEIRECFQLGGGTTNQLNPSRG